MDNPTISEVIQQYLETIERARSANTRRTYQTALNTVTRALEKENIDADKAPITALVPNKTISAVVEYTSGYASATQRLYLTALSGVYDYISSEEIMPINLSKVKSLIKRRSRNVGVRLPQFPTDDMTRLLEHHEKRPMMYPEEAERDYLRDLRDRAFLLTLADTGLRVHEACNLRRGDIDWQEYRAVIVGKGNREAVIRFSERSVKALQDYLNARQSYDGMTGRPLSALPLFARHDKGAGKKILGIQTNTGRNIVADRVREFLGAEAVGTITPHSFRHYFVTRVLQATGNLKMAQMLARHQNIAITQRYSHLSDKELDIGFMQAIEGREE